MSVEASFSASERLRENYHGETLLHRQIGRFNLLENRYAPFLNLQKHSHERAILYFIEGGEVDETFGTRILRLNAGKLLFRPGGEIHGDHFGGRGARCLIIEVPDDWIEGIRESAPFPNEPLCRNDHELARLGRRLCREWRLLDSSAPLIVEGLLLELVGSLARRDRRESAANDVPWLRRAIEIIHACYRQEIHLSILAALIEVHPVHLARAFRRHNRCTVGEYVRGLRIEFACKKLAGTDVPIAAIALDAGFANQAHFSRVFKQVTGTTPAQYRAEASVVNVRQTFQS